MGKIIFLNEFIKEESDYTMCEILEKLRGKTALDLLKAYDISPVPPINVSLLLKRIGIVEIQDDFVELEEVSGHPKGSILGVIFSKDDSLALFYRSTDTINRQRFTIAHEIAHCCLHTDSLKKTHLELRREYTNELPHEQAANIFAGELLIPEDSLRRIHKQFVIPPALTDIASLFQVSTNVMSKRLDYLGLPYVKNDKMNED